MDPVPASSAISLQSMHGNIKNILPLIVVFIILLAVAGWMYERGRHISHGEVVAVAPEGAVVSGIPPGFVIVSNAHIVESKEAAVDTPNGGKRTLYSVKYTTTAAGADIYTQYLLTLNQRGFQLRQSAKTADGGTISAANTRGDTVGITIRGVDAVTTVSMVYSVAVLTQAP